jgi:prephenate dehydratase
VESGKALFAMLPFENSLGGSIHLNYDLQLRHKLHIVAELDFRVEHCLMALPGVARSEIKFASSHPQALAQTDRYLRSIGLIPRAEYDTAGAAKLIAQGKLRDTAAVASSLAAKHYGLEILDSGVEDNVNNYTRFLLLSRDRVSQCWGWLV